MESEDGCLASIAPIFVAALVFDGIRNAFGSPAASWFALGFLVCAVIAFWEAGRRKSKDSTHDQ